MDVKKDVRWLKLLHCTIIMIFLCLFFLLLAVFNSFFTIPVETEHARLKLALAIPIGVPMTVVNDAIEILPVVTDRTINDLSK